MRCLALNFPTPTNLNCGGRFSLECREWKIEFRWEDCCGTCEFPSSRCHIAFPAGSTRSKEDRLRHVALKWAESDEYGDMKRAGSAGGTGRAAAVGLMCLCSGQTCFKTSAPAPPLYVWHVLDNLANFESDCVFLEELHMILLLRFAPMLSKCYYNNNNNASKKWERNFCAKTRAAWKTWKTGSGKRPSTKCPCWQHRDINDSHICGNIISVAQLVR